MKKPKSNSGATGSIPVRFVLPYLPASQVCLAGSFNNWQPTTLHLADPEGSRWEVDVSLPEGAYEYLFVVDDRWVADPNNPRTVPNPFGGVNSVIEVRSTAAAGRRNRKSTP